MMRSLFTGVSGLRAHQTKMDVIAHNIANVNTVGYKSSRVTFAEMFSQTIAGASGANADTGRGGTNPRQIGLGVAIGSVDKLMTQGAAQSTGNMLDVMVDGEGLFIVGDGSGTYFTRAGAFQPDAKGNIVNITGLNVMGWDAIEDANNAGKFIIEKGNVKPLTLSGDKQYVVPKATTTLDFSGNLNPETNPLQEGNLQFFDSLGGSFTMDYQLEYNSVSNQWDYRLGDRVYPDGDRTKPILATVSATGGVVITDAAVPQDIVYTDVYAIEFDLAGKIVPTTTTFAINMTTTSGINPPSTFGTSLNDIILNFNDVTQFKNEKANAKANTADGNAPGTLRDYAIDPSGKITGSYTNGQTRVLGQIPIANFSNPAGLQKVGNNLFMATLNSGAFDGIGEDPTGSGGQMLGSTLEMSNVDLSAEFVDMITTQRGFQANSRVITTSDDMIQELVNLKR